MNQTAPDFSEMTEKEKLEYIEIQLGSESVGGLCRIEDPNCESCQ